MIKEGVVEGEAEEVRERYFSLTVVDVDPLDGKYFKHFPVEHQARVDKKKYGETGDEDRAEQAEVSPDGDVLQLRDGSFSKISDGQGKAGNNEKDMHGEVAVEKKEEMLSESFVCGHQVEEETLKCMKQEHNEGSNPSKTIEEIQSAGGAWRARHGVTFSRRG
jgi:hypothetical protein